MNDIATDPNASLRRSVYWLLILMSAGMMLGRILAVNSVDMAGLEANRLSKIPGELEKKRQTLMSQGRFGRGVEARTCRHRRAIASTGGLAAAFSKRQRPQPLVYGASAGGRRICASRASPTPSTR